MAKQPTQKRKQRIPAEIRKLLDKKFHFTSGFTSTQSLMSNSQNLLKVKSGIFGILAELDKMPNDVIEREIDVKDVWEDVQQVFREMNAYEEKIDPEGAKLRQAEALADLNLEIEGVVFGGLLGIIMYRRHIQSGRELKELMKNASPELLKYFNMGASMMRSESKHVTTPERKDRIRSYCESILALKMVSPTLEMLEEQSGLSASTWSRLFSDPVWLFSLKKELKKRQSRKFSKKPETKAFWESAEARIDDVVNDSYARKTKGRTTLGES